MFNFTENATDSVYKLIQKPLETLKLWAGNLLILPRSFDIMAFTETWLHQGISNEDLKVATYQTPERKDRTENPHGGVLIYIKENTLSLSLSLSLSLYIFVDFVKHC